MDSITEAINEGSIYKFFLKPWNDNNLMLEIRQALKQHDLMETNVQLHETILQQNEELKAINENLEQMVSERTQSLEIQNRALQLSHAVLEDLPHPIIGISSEMMIVLANKTAQKLALTDGPINLGDAVGEYFSEPFQQDLSTYLDTSEPVLITGRGKNGRTYDINLIPLSGRFSGKGMILNLGAAKE